jgi:hypothetical protein
MKQTRQSNTKTQLDKANEVLIDMAVNVTSDDRNVAIKELGINRQTVGQYLRGEAKDLDVATRMIRIFRTRIADREKEFSLATKYLRKFKIHMSLHGKAPIFT